MYSPWINRLPWVCLIAPGAGFGIVMVAGNFSVIAAYDQLTYLTLLLPFCLSNNLLLLNQYPDIHADKNVGRRTFPIV
ncbi:UbiA family prenyltransferase [Oleiphilus sp. HI0125]|uniref:UbiA family prenyltransferase n=1 Tax=Oleiphilus sp. HI0125 TaxID=1822266 RepID=UPI0012E7C533